MPSSKTKDVKLFNLDTFLPDVNAARADGRINSPRSLVVVQRMGYEANDLLPIPKKALFTKHHDNEDSLQMKFDDFTMKRLKKIEECRAEYGICKEFCKYATLDQYARQPIKMHWIPPSGDPSGKKARKALSDKEKTKMMAATSGPDPTAIKIMAEAAANQASQMMDIEMKKMEAIKRRQKREIDRVVANEGKMAVLQAKILKAELDELDRKRDHDKVVMLNRKAAITKKQQFDVEKKSELDQEIIERNKIAAREMLVERKLAEKEKKLEVVRRREAREKEVSEQSERAFLKTIILAMKCAKWLQPPTSTTKLTLFHPIRLARSFSFRSSFIKNAPRFARRRFTEHHSWSNGLRRRRTSLMISKTRRRKPGSALRSATPGSRPRLRKRRGRRR